MLTRVCKPCRVNYSESQKLVASNSKMFWTLGVKKTPASDSMSAEPAPNAAVNGSPGSSKAKHYMTLEARQNLLAKEGVDSVFASLLQAFVMKRNKESMQTMNVLAYEESQVQDWMTQMKKKNPTNQNRIITVVEQNGSIVAFCYVNVVKISSIGMTLLRIENACCDNVNDETKKLLIQRCIENVKKTHNFDAIETDVEFGCVTDVAFYMKHFEMGLDLPTNMLKTATEYEEIKQKLPIINNDIKKITPANAKKLRSCAEQFNAFASKTLEMNSDSNQRLETQYTLRTITGQPKTCDFAVKFLTIHCQSIKSPHYASFQATGNIKTDGTFNESFVMNTEWRSKCLKALTLYRNFWTEIIQKVADVENIDGPQYSNCLESWSGE